MGDLITIDFRKKKDPREELTRREGAAFRALEEAMRRHERQKNIKAAILITVFVVAAMAFPFALDYFVNSL